MYSLFGPLFSFATTETGAHENAHGNMLVVASSKRFALSHANITGNITHTQFSKEKEAHK